MSEAWENEAPWSAADEALVRAAIAARARAYAPYSNYAVGAALCATDGQIFSGCNVENAAYPSTICAERTALVKAVSEGQREFLSIAVVASGGGGPCGACRQMLYEFAPRLRVLMANPSGRLLLEARLDELLPHGFGPAELRG